MPHPPARNFAEKLLGYRLTLPPAFSALCCRTYRTPSVPASIDDFYYSLPYSWPKSTDIFPWASRETDPAWKQMNPYGFCADCNELYARYCFYTCDAILTVDALLDFTFFAGIFLSFQGRFRSFWWDSAGRWCPFLVFGSQSCATYHQLSWPTSHLTLWPVLNATVLDEIRCSSDYPSLSKYPKLSSLI